MPVLFPNLYKVKLSTFANWLLLTGLSEAHSIRTNSTLCCSQETVQQSAIFLKGARVIGVTSR